MKKSRFSEKQIIRILKDQEAGQTTAVVCRHHGIAESTFYKWWAQVCKGAEHSHRTARQTPYDFHRYDGAGKE